MQNVSQISRRPVYRYSVVAGGVEDAAEAVAAVRRDRLVAAHYSGVRTTRLRPARANGDAMRFVSYRRGNRILWTRSKHRIAAEELVLTDGANEIRARCGNRLSNTPQVPVAPEASDDPSDSELGTTGVDDLTISERNRPPDPKLVSPAVGLPPHPLPSDARPAGDPALVGEIIAQSSAAGLHQHIPSGPGLHPPLPLPEDPLLVVDHLAEPRTAAVLPIPTPTTPAFAIPAELNRGLVVEAQQQPAAGAPSALIQDGSRSPSVTSRGGPLGSQSVGGSARDAGTSTGTGGSNESFGGSQLISRDISDGGTDGGDDQRRGTDLIPDPDREPEPVPEPGTWVLLLSSAASFAAWKALKRRGNRVGSGNSRTPSSR